MSIKDIEKIIHKVYLSQYEKHDDTWTFITNTFTKDLATQLQEMIAKDYIPKSQVIEMLDFQKIWVSLDRCVYTKDWNSLRKEQLAKIIEKDLLQELKKLDNTIETDQPKWYKDVKK